MEVDLIMNKDIGIGVIGLGFGQTLFPLNNIAGSRFIVKAACGMEAKETVVDVLKKWDINILLITSKNL